MFSFSSVLKNKEFSTSPAKPVTIKTPIFECATSSYVAVQSVAKTTSTLSLSNVKLQSGHSKVQDWLKSSSPFIVHNDEGTQHVTSVTSCIQNISPPEIKAKGNGADSAGNSTSIRFISDQATSITQPRIANDLDVMEFIPRPSFLTPSPSKLVPIPLPSVHHAVTTAAAANKTNIIPVKGQGKSFTSVASKSNLLELQKAALQAAAVNQISSRLHNHLKKDNLNERKTETCNYIIKDSSNYRKPNEAVYQTKDMLAAEIVDRRHTENVHSYLKGGSMYTGSNGVVMSHLTITTGSTVVANHFNKLINTSCIQAVSETTAPAPQSRILIMPNRSFHESSGKPMGVVSFSSPSQVNLQPARPLSLVSQAITNRFNPLIVSTTASKITLINPTTPSTCNSLPFVKAPIPIQISQSAVNQSITTLPSTKYLTFAPKPVVMQQSQLSKLTVPTVPTLSKISQPHTARFQTISSDVPVLHPKSTITNKQVIVQQRLRDQGQTVRYILPAQTQLPSGQVINLNNLNQLGSVQNLFLNNVPIVKNQTTKSVRIISGNLSNGITKSSTNSKVVLTPSLGINRYPTPSPVASVGNSAHVKINETILMRSPVKPCNPVNNQRSQVTPIQNTNPVLAISHSTPKKPDTIENTVICSSLTSTPKIEYTSQINDNNSATLQRQLQPLLPDTRKLLPKTASPSLPNGICTQTMPNSSNPSSNIKSPDGKTTEKPRHVVLEPAQLQKLKEEGRIVMTPTGQLIMIPPNLVGKVPGSVFK